MQKHRGGGTDAAAGIFYAQTAQGGPSAISRATLSVIDQTPMFNALSPQTVIPGPSGIVPSGIALMHTGGGNLAGLTVPSLRDLCNSLGLSCKNQKGGFLTKTQMVQRLRGTKSGRQ